jgi:hypothetical protein
MRGVIDQEYKQKRVTVAGMLSELEKEGDRKITMTRTQPALATVKDTRSQIKLDTQ